MVERIRNARRAEGQAGFTLIELLVVIIILGILAAVVVFAVGGVGDKGQAAACKIDTRTLRTAEEAFAAQPTTATPAGGGGKYTDGAGLVAGGFLSENSTYHIIKSSVAAETAPLFTGFVIQIADATTCVKAGTTSTAGAPVNGTTIF